MVWYGVVWQDMALYGGVWQGMAGRAEGGLRAGWGVIRQPWGPGSLMASPRHCHAGYPTPDTQLMAKLSAPLPLPPHKQLHLHNTDTQCIL